LSNNFYKKICHKSFLGYPFLSLNSKLLNTSFFDDRNYFSYFSFYNLGYFPLFKIFDKNLKKISIRYFFKKFNFGRFLYKFDLDYFEKFLAKGDFSKSFLKFYDEL
jgi:hypothetical protein